MASGSDGLVAMVVGIALGGVGYELARTGDLGPSLKKIADQIDTSLGIGVTTPGSAAKTGPPSTVDTVNATGATIYCKDGAARVLTWDQVDSDLKQAGWGGQNTHDKAEAQALASACTGP